VNLLGEYRAIISHAVKFQGKIEYIKFQMKDKEVSFVVTHSKPTPLVAL
jgi:hypothetical protein